MASTVWRNLKRVVEKILAEVSGKSSTAKINWLRRGKVLCKYSGSFTVEAGTSFLVFQA